MWNNDLNVRSFRSKSSNEDKKTSVLNFVDVLAKIAAEKKYVEEIETYYNKFVEPEEATMSKVNFNDIISISKEIYNLESNDIISSIGHSTNLKSVKEYHESVFFKVVQLNYEEEYPLTQAMENALTVLNECSCNFVYLIHSDHDGVKLYVGVSEHENTQHADMSIKDYGKILRNSFEGNFQGSIINTVSKESYEKEVVRPIEKSNYFSVVSGIPSKENSDDEKNMFQSIDRLLHSMQGEEFTILLVSKPWKQSDVDQLRDNIYSAYNKLYSYKKTSMQVSDDNTILTAEKSSKDSVTSSSEEERRESGSPSSSVKKTKSGGEVTKAMKDNSKTKSQNRTSKEVINVEYIEKEIQSLLGYMDDILMKRVHIGYRKGLFETTTYFAAKKNSVLRSVEKSFVSLFQGESESINPLNVRKYNQATSKKLSRNLMLNFDIFYENTRTKVDPLIASICSIPWENGNRGLSALLTSEEVSLIAGLPRKEVVGIHLNHGVEFGLNIKEVQNENKIKIGKIMHKGSYLKSDANIDKKALDKHVFIAGVTGTGKTTTCQNLLIESRVSFLVIEPVKTEYRELIRSKYFKDDVFIFTLGNEKISPFRINPFEILPNETITAHVDMLKASFEAAFKMEAAMPQILEAAIYNCYEDYGWNINDDSNEFLVDRNDAFDGSGLYFPILSDLIEAIKVVVDKQGFDDRLKNDYIGSLVARINGLIVGSKGQMLNCRKSMDFDWLLDHNVVLELEDLKSGSDKALLMGFILSRLRESLKARFSVDHGYKHITLIEEAHRLLTNTSISGGSSKAESVEMFTDMLAEVRKYGESLIVVDQIPNKLAPDVLKNTNTKIIHKLFAQDDKDSVGNTMALTEEQKRHLSYLKVGEAIVFSQGWDKPVQVKINKLSDTSGVVVPIKMVKSGYYNYLKTVIKNRKHIYSWNMDRKLLEELISYELRRSLIVDILYHEFVVEKDFFNEDRISRLSDRLLRQYNIMESELSIELFYTLLAKEAFYIKAFRTNRESEKDFVKVYTTYFKIALKKEYDKVSNFKIENRDYF